MENRQLLKNVLRLSIPAILTQITTIAMQYIDSAMVGKLGANASAAIGLVSATTWVFGGIVFAIAIGFSVQVAHQVGAEKYADARSVVKHGLLVGMLLGVVLCIIGILLSKPLPVWLKADVSIHQDATYYFLMFALMIPFMQLCTLSASFLQCSGDMLIPSILNSLMCILDVIFNMIFIPRYGVLGAGMGTGLATVVISIIMFGVCCFKNDKLRLNRKERFIFDGKIVSSAFRIGLPVCGEQVATNFASVIITGIIAPLGTIAIAAHAFAITAESICYMPGYGLESAATTLVGQAYGAKEYDISKKYGNMTTLLGALLMGTAGLFMFFFCPVVFRMLTPDVEVQILAARVLRICLVSEPLFGISIVATGALRGVEDTLVPGLLKLFSVWVVRIGLALVFVGNYGLEGVWVAMTIDLCFRGIVLWMRLQRSPYFKK